MDKRTLDLSAPEIVQNPYNLFCELRQDPFPAWMVENQDVKSEGKWVFSRYEDVKKILQMAEGVSKDITRFREKQDISVFDSNMLTQDPPNHTRLRRIANQAFSPDRITGLSEFIKESAADLIDSIKKSGEEFDFIHSFAAPLPILVITKLLGVPLKDQFMFRDWSIALSLCFDSGNSDPDIISKKRRIFSEIHAYFINIIERRRSEPKDDLISKLIHLHDVEGKLSSEEVLAMCMLILFAGNDTTINLIGNGLYSLLKNPSQFQLLTENPSLVKSAVEEMLRYESPVQRSTFRVCIEEIKIGEVVISKGDQICGLIGAANRDPHYFEQPEQFDIRRSPNRHLAFGLGSHACIGSLLARTEASYAFNSIIEYLPNIRLAKDEIEWNPNSFVRGLKSLPVKLF
ncbi:MAG: cytochrome P450 [Verrucomicrobiota bacterium]